MKKTLLVGILLLSAATMAFADGKISFRNDLQHLVYLDPDPLNLLPADTALAGQAVPVGGLLPSGAALSVDLLAGNSASSLQLVSSVTTWPVIPGEWGITNLNLPSGFSAGVPLYFEVQVHDSSFDYFGESPVFTCYAGASITYDSITLPLAPSFSTWAAGTYPLDNVDPGATGAIVVSLVPEPAAATLAGLGAAMASLRFRRETK